MQLGRLSLLILCTVLLASAGLRADVPVPEKVDFNRDVRPILSENCFACHGFDAAARKGDLRLDTKDGILAAVKAAKPSEAELVKRVTHADADERMPPADSGKFLTPRQVEVLKRWVEQGAEYKGHWSYLKPTRPQVSPIDQPGFVRNPIDRFVLARLKEQNYTPSP